MLENIGGMQYVPLVGDVYDIEHGSKKLFNSNLSAGDRALGAAQALVGIGGLATLGVGSGAKSLAKAGLKAAIKYGAKRAGKAGAKAIGKKAARSNVVHAARRFTQDPSNVINAAARFGDNVGDLASNGRGFMSYVHPFKYAGLVEGSRLGGNLLFGTPKQGKDVTQGYGSNGSTNNGGAYRYGGGSYGYGVGGSGGVGGLTPEQQNDILQQIAQGGSLIRDGYSDYGRELIDRYMMNQSMMDPYRKNLQNYIRDYNNRADWAYNQDRELAALAGLTGNNAYAQMIGKNNALVNEANRLGLFKTAGEDLKSAGEGLDTLLGNMDLARQVGLPLSAANADTKMAQLAVNKMINDNRDENKLRIAQYNGALKLQIAQEKAKMQMYRRAGNVKGANDSYKRLRALIQAAGSGIPIETINAYTGLNIPTGVQQSTGEVRLDR